MKFGDYLHHQGPADFRGLDEKLDQSDRDSWADDLRELTPNSDVVLGEALALPAAAYRNAPPMAGRYPRVLFSGGKASRADANVELAEYLASHGYVVATVPQLGPSGQQLELGSSAAELALHADDFDAALHLLRSFPDIDFSRIASAGHSAGGEVAVELALRHPQITAVIGRDASFGMTGGARIFRKLPEYAPGRKLPAELLDLRRAQGSQCVELDLSAIDSLRWARLYRVMFPNGFHGDFTEWGMTGYKLAVPMPQNPDGHTRQVGYQVNQRVCHLVLDFLDAQLKNQPGAVRRMKSEVEGLPGPKTNSRQRTPIPSKPAHLPGATR